MYLPGASGLGKLTTPYIPLATLRDYSLFAIGGALPLFGGTLLVSGGSFWWEHPCYWG